MARLDGICYFCRVRAASKDVGKGVLCAACVNANLYCRRCEHGNEEWLDLMKADPMQWHGNGMPTDCFGCGDRAINKKIKAVGVSQHNFPTISQPSYMRRRLSSS